ncbi:hypothetical protein EDB85DRAFT_2158396 [Lactarius pseudohatsudake]|nr:hypothetical protein EDB85DRAFT_2158396 [Lactarius pseudohatsudake]
MLLVFLLVALLVPWQVAFTRLLVHPLRDLPDARSPAPRRHADSAPSVLAFALPFSRSQTGSPLPPADTTRINTAPVLAVWARTLATAGLWARLRRVSPPLQDSLVATSFHGTHICTRHANGCIHVRPHLAAHSLKPSTGPKTHELTEYLRIHSECGLRLGVNLEFTARAQRGGLQRH